MMLTILFVLIGLVAGFLSGLFGIGGGIIIIPALIACFHMLAFNDNVIVHLAMGTSLASIVFTSAATAFHQYQHKVIAWEILKPLLPGLIIGVLFGVSIADSLPSHILQQGFAVFLVLIAFKMLFWHEFAWISHASAIQYGLLGLGTGVVSGILGLGGGVLLVPALQLLSIPIHIATATSAACLWPTVLCGAIAQMIMGWDAVSLPAYAIGYVYWPAACVIGLASIVSTKPAVKLSHQLPKQTLARLFSGVLLLIALKLWISV